MKIFVIVLIVVVGISFVGMVLVGDMICILYDEFYGVIVIKEVGVLVFCGLLLICKVVVNFGGKILLELKYMEVCEINVVVVI